MRIILYNISYMIYDNLSSMNNQLLSINYNPSIISYPIYYPNKSLGLLLSPLAFSSASSCSTTFKKPSTSLALRNLCLNSPLTCSNTKISIFSPSNLFLSRVFLRTLRVNVRPCSNDNVSS